MKSRGKIMKSKANKKLDYKYIGQRFYYSALFVEKKQWMIEL